MRHSDKLLNELIELQANFRLIDTDCAKIIGISRNYYCTIKIKSYVSTFFLPVLETAVSFLKQVSKDNPNLHFGKLRAESTASFRNRKYRMIAKFQKKFKQELQKQDQKDNNFRLKTYKT
jgi:hypothetical protein